MAWQVTYPPEFRVNIGEQPPRARFVPNFNGISQSLSVNLSLNTGDKIEFKTNFTSTGGIASFFDIETTRYRFRVDQTGNVNMSGVTAKVDGQAISNGDPFPQNSTVDVEITLVESFSVQKLLVAFNDASLWRGLVYDVKVNDGSVYNFPMDDGFQNNPTMRNTGSGADGTFINMTEAAWQQITL